MPGPNLIKQRSCLYYVPWWFTISLALLVTSIGVWIPYGDSSAESANQALDILNVSTWISLNKAPWQIYVVVASIYLAIVVAMLAMTVARTAIEAKHDKTSTLIHGGEAWMLIHIILTIIWWALVLWNIMLIAGMSIYLVCAQLLWGAINNVLGLQATLTELPSWSGPPQACPATCLNFNMLTFIDHSDNNSCVCSNTQLNSAKDTLDDAIWDGNVSLGAACFMCLGALAVLTNFMCQFSHMKCELDYLERFQKNIVDVTDVPPPYPMPVEHEDVQPTVTTPPEAATATQTRAEV